MIFTVDMVYTVYTVYTVDAVDAVDTVDTVDPVDTVYTFLTASHCLNSSDNLMRLTGVTGLIIDVAKMEQRMDALFHFDCLGHKEFKKIAYNELWEPYAVTRWDGWTDGRDIPLRLL